MNRMKVSLKLSYFKNFNSLFWLAIVLVVLVQISLSVNDAKNIILLFFFVGSVICFYLVLRMDSPHRSYVMLGCMYIFNTVILAGIIKTVLFQPLSSNLYAPIESYAASFVAFLAVLLAIYISKRTPVGKPILKSQIRLKKLKYLSVYSFIIGTIAWFLHQSYLIDRRSVYFDPQESFGGFGIFTNLLFMGIICATAYVIYSTDKKKSMNIYVLFMLIIVSAMSIVESRLTNIGLAFVSYFATAIFLRSKITSKQIVLSASMILFLFFVITPIVQYYRSTLWYIPIEQRINYVLDNFNEIYSPRNISYYYGKIKDKEVDRYRYFGFNAGFIDRFAAVQINDDIISEVVRQGFYDSKFYYEDYVNMLPSFLYPNKDPFSTGDILRWHYGLRYSDSIGFTLAPLISNAYSAGGMILVFFFVLYCFLFLFLVLKKLNWNLDNVYGIFFFLLLAIGIHQNAHYFFVNNLIRIIPMSLLIFIIYETTYSFLAKIKS
jgi:hypothetical protein